ncbi:hypothetical protein N0V83_009147 [Neocucurbitaria cava]|uniref:Uncharacterized protein n=1 Tax=Neocucurbitaria cava TaxID=798079 RepID=A0A9W8Y265_9PLEO|nr:hypothetical protein N0V83_009147 [Neocucurbitaria cava]
MATVPLGRDAHSRMIGLPSEEVARVHLEDDINAESDVLNRSQELRERASEADRETRLLFEELPASLPDVEEPTITAPDGDTGASLSVDNSTGSTPPLKDAPEDLTGLQSNAQFDLESQYSDEPSAQEAINEVTRVSRGTQTSYLGRWERWGVLQLAKEDAYERGYLAGREEQRLQNGVEQSTQTENPKSLTTGCTQTSPQPLEKTKGPETQRDVKKNRYIGQKNDITSGMERLEREMAEISDNEDMHYVPKKENREPTEDPFKALLGLVRTSKSG